MNPAQSDKPQLKVKPPQELEHKIERVKEVVNEEQFIMCCTQL